MPQTVPASVLTGLLERHRTISRPSLVLLHLIHLGRIDFHEALDIQRDLVALRKQGRIGDTLLLLEHPPVLTLGRNSHRANILATDDTLAARGVAVYETNRGGDVTYHGPGQVVGYPILDLRGQFPGKRGPHLGAVEYVRLLEEVLIRTCGEFGVLTQRIPGRTGVWTLESGSIPEKKIAAIGVHISQAVTSHGFAWNLTTDLRDFDWIVPCGIRDRAVTSLEAEINTLQHAMPTFEQAMHTVARKFGSIFGRQVLWTESVAELLAQVQETT